MDFKDFIKECNEKEVFKNLSIYVVSSWILIQVFSVIWEPFGLPKISMTYLLLVLLIGFPFYIYLFWKYRLKPLESKLSRRDGLKFTGKQATSKSSEGTLKKRKIHLPGVHFYSPFQKMYFTSLFIITLISIFSASLIVKANFISEKNVAAMLFPEEVEKNNRIAVLKFENKTADSNLDVVGNMAEDWIMHGITQVDSMQVISPKAVTQYTKVLKASMVPDGENSVLKEFLKPSKIVKGTCYLNDGRLLISSSITDGSMSRILVSFTPVECSPESPLDCIEELKQRILGYLSTRGKDKNIGLEESPPKYKAYQLFLEADKVNYYEPEHLRLLNEAIAADSTFVKPKVARISYYYNQGQFAIADSLLQALSTESKTSKTRLKNTLLSYQSLLEGDNRNAYKYWKAEYNVEPFNLELNASALVLALQYVNRPQDLDTIYNAFGSEDKDLDINNIYIETRLYIKGLANLELGRTQETIEMLRPFSMRKYKDYDWLKECFIRALVLEGNSDSVAIVMDQTKLYSEKKNWRKSCLITGNEFLRVGNEKLANEYYDQLIQSVEANMVNISQDELELYARAYFYKKEYQKAQQLLESILPNSANQIELTTYLAMASYKNGHLKKAEMLLEQIDAKRSPYQFGKVDYEMARYFANAGDEERTLQYLLKSISAGNRYLPATFQHDILLRPYIQSEGFKQIMNYWN
jgi:TolB-like protein